MWWSYILTFVGLTGFILAGRKVWWSWYINIACQFLWLAYAQATHQYGFVIGAVVYFVVFTTNAIAWTKERFPKTEPWDSNKVVGHIDGVRVDEHGLHATETLTPEMAACYRFHGLEPCRLGQNHPTVNV